MVTTGAVLSAANWRVLVRLTICCVCCAASNSRSSGETGGSGSSIRDEGDGSWPVLTNTQVGSPQTAMIDGNAGGLDAEVGLLSAMNGSTVLPGPPLAVPLADELVMVPTGKLEPGTESAGKLTNWALAPAKPPTALWVAPVALPEAVEESMMPKFAPTKPPMMSLLPVPVTEPDALEDAIVPIFTPAKPPR